MTHYLLYSWVPLILIVGLLCWLIYAFANYLMRLKRTFVIRNKAGKQISFEVGQNENFEDTFKSKLSQLQSSGNTRSASTGI